ncbi:MAG: energy-coupling factor transporter transmembrane component T [Zestosphaera sp.]
MPLKYRKSTPFIYAIGVSVMAFVGNSVRFLLLPSLVNGMVGFTFGSKKMPVKLLLLLLLLNTWGSFVNALYFHNAGEVVMDTPFITIRSGVVESFSLVGLRFLLVVGATLVMLSMSNPRDLVRSLERDLRIPPGIAFSIAYAFRLFPLMSRDLSEVLISRKERGVRTFVLNPSNLRSVLLPLLNLSYERAVWGGISAELRGLRSRRNVRGDSIGVGDLLIILALILQWIASYLISLML